MEPQISNLISSSLQYEIEMPQLVSLNTIWIGDSLPRQSSKWKATRMVGKTALKVLDYAVFSRFSAHLGGKVKMIFVSSGGHIAPAHRKFLSIIFCTHISECYMRTETGIIAATSRSMYDSNWS